MVCGSNIAKLVPQLEKEDPHHMIKGTFKRNEAGQIVSFEISGHAESGDYGTDIVCAAVSALTLSTVNGIDSLAGFTPIVESNNAEGGYLYMEVIDDITQEQRNIAQILLENLLLGLQATEKNYKKFIEIRTLTK